MKITPLMVLVPLAGLGLGFAVYAATGERPLPPPVPAQAPPRTPYPSCVAGAGLVEARSENVNVGSAIAGVVSAVFVQVGDEVAAGAPLFVLDERADRALVGVRRAELAAARSALERLRQLPRPESIPPLEAALREAEARHEDACVQLARWESLARQSVVNEHEVSLKRYAALVAARQVERAGADLALTRAGAWAPDLCEAEAALAVAAAQLTRAEVDLKRLTVRAPAPGRILRVNVHPGELVQPSTTALVVGDTGRLHVRVSIDESDVPRFSPGAPARAMLKGQPEPALALRFVRTEPFVVPKRSLTGQSDERVDTRVLEVIYELEDAPPGLIFVGQQVDAYVRSAP